LVFQQENAAKERTRNDLESLTCRMAICPRDTVVDQRVEATADLEKLFAIHVNNSKSSMTSCKDILTAKRLSQRISTPAKSTT
jgi:hypothetical protein